MSMISNHSAVVTPHLWSEGVRIGIQISRRETHTHIYLNWARVKFLFYIKKKKINAK